MELCEAQGLADGKQQKQLGGFAILVLVIMWYGGGIIDHILLVGVGGAAGAEAPLQLGAPCADSDAQCAQWAAAGECLSNAVYMSATCALACGKCQPAAAAAPCADSDPGQCPLWKANGDCASNSEYMLAMCRLSCDPSCGAPAAPAAGAACVDADLTQCPLWQANGDCSSNSVYMMAMCCRSCTNPVAAPAVAAAAPAAPAVKAAAAAPAAPCVDSDPEQCPRWQANGDCASNTEWMRANCPVSCDVCTPASAEPCADSDERQCPVWATNGDCTSNLEWMSKNCRLSCKVCSLSASLFKWPGARDGEIPQTASWDGPIESPMHPNGCTDAEDMPFGGDPVDNCMKLCAKTKK
jgi:hypothetical protein